MTNEERAAIAVTKFFARFAGMGSNAFWRRIENKINRAMIRARTMEAHDRLVDLQNALYFNRMERRRHRKHQRAGT